MARTPLALTHVALNGDNLVTQSCDPVNGNTVPWAGDGLLMIFTAAVPCTVSVDVATLVDASLTVAARSFVLTPGTSFIWYTDRQDIYAQADGTVHFDVSDACTVSLYTL
jgi:hypothetical protein